LFAIVWNPQKLLHLKRNIYLHVEKNKDSECKSALWWKKSEIKNVYRKICKHIVDLERWDFMRFYQYIHVFQQIFLSLKLLRE